MKKLHNICTAIFGSFLMYSFCDWFIIGIQASGWKGLFLCCIGVVLYPIAYPVHLFYNGKWFAFSWFVLAIISLVILKVTGGFKKEQGEDNEENS